MLCKKINDTKKERKMSQNNKNFVRVYIYIFQKSLTWGNCYHTIAFEGPALKEYQSNEVLKLIFRVK